MGNCRSSCESTSSPTVKLILEDGQLQEFSNPVKVSQVLQNYSRSSTSATCCVCDSDGMEVGQFVCALNAEDELEVGQLYFVLPLNLSKSPFQAKDLAALAVKASLALCRTRRPLVFGSTKIDATEGRSSVHIQRRGGGGRVGLEFVRKRKRSSRFGRGFIRSLSVIVEE